MACFRNREVQEEYVSTIGLEFGSKTIIVDGIAVRLDIWDAGGHIRFRSLIPSYLLGKQGILYIFDTTNRESFAAIEGWLSETPERSADTVRFLIGNKADLDDKRAVTYAEANEFATAYGMTYTETSARTGDNVGQVFYSIALKILEERRVDLRSLPLKLSPDRVPLKTSCF
eukprot:TRINITY_DN5145_c0_g2_i6.p1 TRINITY_DN5145_c0_g2~~TRINITY_DN5145_c0_g2_i6.p1  ORF type:complete len:172 (+),score=34.48 TRINITY_DN5145_c0_g2_i6:213-728(+)